MFQNKHTITRLLFLLAILTAWSVALYRDFTIGKLFPLDLRNRVVGARLIHDGISPYFYKWKPGKDSIRYYDSENFDNYTVSVSTSTPFYHHLIGPLAEMPQVKIQTWWVAIQHAMLLIMVALALLTADSPRAKYIILAFVALFLYTDAWKMSIQNGQNYLIPPLLAMCIYHAIVRLPRSKMQAVFTGTCTIVLLLIRPLTLVFFLPLLFLWRLYDRKWRMTFAIPILLLGGWTILNKTERNLWMDYRIFLSQHVKIHQELHPAVQVNAPDPKYILWEGIDVIKLDTTYGKAPMHIQSENGNMFYLVRLATNYRIPPWMLMTSCAVILLTLAGLYTRSKVYDPATTLLFGYCLYLILDIFSPIFRAQYYTVQLLFPILVAATIPRFQGKWVQGAILAGILLNIAQFSFLPIRHTIGEYLIIVVITFFSLTREENSKTLPYRHNTAVKKLR